MAYQTNLGWIRNGASPLFDQGYKGGGRPVGGGGGLGEGLAKYAPFNVQIIQPVAGLDTSNRYYKQYPGIEYNVKVYVRGGDWSALSYSLTTAPEGMTINQKTGVISWPNPTTTGSPHSVTASVTDGISTDTVSWTVTVSTANTIFVDASAVTSGDGSIGSPLKDVPGWFLNDKNDATYAGSQVYYRAGTYTPDSTDKDARGSLTLSNGDKPVIHMAYPGESVTFDMSLGFFFTDTQIHDFYIDGIQAINVGDYVASGEGVWFTRLFGDRHVYRRLNCSGLKNTAGSFNQAYIMAVTSSARNERWCISEGQFDGNNANGYTLGIFYRTDLNVIERNTLTNCALIGIGHKTENTTQSIRGNVATGTGKLYDAIGFTDGVGTGNAEYSWNYGNGAEPVAINDGLTGADSDFHFIRNTFTSPVFIREWIAAESSGFIRLTDNVIVGATSYESELAVDAALIDEEGTLLNSTATDFLNLSTGLLTGGFDSQNATKGFNGLGGHV